MKDFDSVKDLLGYLDGWCDALADGINGKHGTDDNVDIMLMNREMNTISTIMKLINNTEMR